MTGQAEEVHSGQTSTARMPSDDLTGRSGFGQRSSGRGLSRRRAIEAFSFLSEIPGGLAFQIVDKVTCHPGRLHLAFGARTTEIILAGDRRCKQAHSP